MDEYINRADVSPSRYNGQEIWENLEWTQGYAKMVVQAA